MNYLTFIDRCSHNEPSLIPIQFLVSGSDPVIRSAVLSDVARKCRAGGRPLVIVSDNGATESTDLGIIQAAGYRLRNAMSGDCCLYDPFQKISTMDGLSRLRQLFTVLGCDERQKGKLVAYLNFIRHLECLKTGSPSAALTLERLGAYCTSMAVELQLQELVDAGKLTPQQQLAYLAKYAECSGAGADLEDTLALMLPFIREQGKTPGEDPGEALVFSTGALGTDESLRNLILKLLQFSLEDRQDPNVTVLVFDRGYGSRTGMASFLTTLPRRSVCTSSPRISAPCATARR